MKPIHEPISFEQAVYCVELLGLPYSFEGKNLVVSLGQSTYTFKSERPAFNSVYVHHRDPKTKVGVGMYFKVADALYLLNNELKEKQ